MAFLPLFFCYNAPPQFVLHIRVHNLEVINSVKNKESVFVPPVMMAKAKM